MIIGCGPTVPVGGTGGGSSTSDPGSSTMPPDPGTTAEPSDTTSTSAATVGTFGDPDTSSSGESFLTPPDGGGPICHSCCDLWAQDCGDGDKCMPWANDGTDDWNGTRCSPIADRPGSAGDPCTMEGSVASGIDDCDLGLMCWNVDPDTLQGTCVPLCTGSEDNPVCDEPTQCFIANEGSLILCLPPCDPLMPECDPGEACLPNDAGFVCVSTSAGEDGAAGDPCSYVYDCQPGLVCASPDDVGPPCDPGAPGCCTPWCDLGAADPTAPCFDPSQICTPWWEPGTWPPGLETLGVCAVP